MCLDPTNLKHTVTDLKFTNTALFPAPQGLDSVELASRVPGFDLLQQVAFEPRTFFYLHARWPSELGYQLPPGYNRYVVSFHLEQIDFEWLQNQFVGPITVLSDFNSYQDYQIPNVTFHRWLYWHHALKKMQQWHGTKYEKNIKYKASAFCNRISQSKLIVTTALLDILSSDAAISLGTWIESKNVHNWQPTGIDRLDQLIERFRSTYLGTRMTMDEFTQSKNDQTITSSPHHPAYQQTALHFTNESFNYSLMHEQGQQKILPGPHLTEKTLKCLLGGTAFIPVGQFDVYRTLTELGLEFNYGLDLGFDQDPGNLTRLVKTLDLIDTLSDIDAVDLFQQTLVSTQHNQHCIVSGDFYDQCQEINLLTLQQL